MRTIIISAAPGKWSPMMLAVVVVILGGCGGSSDTPSTGTSSVELQSPAKRAEYVKMVGPYFDSLLRTNAALDVGCQYTRYVELLQECEFQRQKIESHLTAEQRLSASYRSMAAALSAYRRARDTWSDGLKPRQAVDEIGLQRHWADGGLALKSAREAIADAAKETETTAYEAELARRQEAAERDRADVAKRLAEQRAVDSAARLKLQATDDERQDKLVEVNQLVRFLSDPNRSVRVGTAKRLIAMVAPLLSDPHHKTAWTEAAAVPLCRMMANGDEAERTAAMRACEVLAPKAAYEATELFKDRPSKYAETISICRRAAAERLVYLEPLLKMVAKSTERDDVREAAEIALLSLQPVKAP